MFWHGWMFSLEWMFWLGWMLWLYGYFDTGECFHSMDLLTRCIFWLGWMFWHDGWSDSGVMWPNECFDSMDVLDPMEVSTRSKYSSSKLAFVPIVGCLLPRIRYNITTFSLCSSRRRRENTRSTYSRTDISAKGTSVQHGQGCLGTGVVTSSAAWRGQ